VAQHDQAEAPAAYRRKPGLLKTWYCMGNSIAQLEFRRVRESAAIVRPEGTECYSLGLMPEVGDPLKQSPGGATQDR
jgi:hypothetical protein